jgi:hypothetical protein
LNHTERVSERSYSPSTGDSLADVKWLLRLRGLVGKDRTTKGTTLV